MSYWRWCVAVVTTAKMACTPAKPNTAPVTTNDCPQHSCSAYAPADASICVGGTCLVPTGVGHVSGLMLVVAIPNDAVSAPGRTYTQRVTVLDASAQLGVAPSIKLPSTGSIFGAYEVDPTISKNELHWDLGNPGSNTYLPSKVNYRPLWDAPTGLVDALDAGLPTYAVFADQTELPTPIPGPAGGPSIQFRADLPPGTYEQAIVPQPPFDRAFPPDVSVVVVKQGVSQQIGLTELRVPDKTT